VYLLLLTILGSSVDGESDALDVREGLPGLSGQELEVDHVHGEQVTQELQDEPYEDRPEDLEAPPEAPDEKEQMSKIEESVRDQMMSKWANGEKGRMEQDVDGIIDTESKEIALAKKEYANDYANMKREVAAGKKMTKEETAELEKEKEDEEKEEEEVTDERSKIVALMEEADHQIDMLKQNTLRLIRIYTDTNFIPEA
jgi:hypothetical protein